MPPALIPTPWPLHRARALLVAVACSLGSAAGAQESANAPAAPTEVPAPAATPAPAAASEAGLARPEPAVAAPAAALPAAGPAAAAPPAPAAPRQAAKRPPSTGGPRWSSLSAAQRRALRPLQGEWHEIDAARKQKWIEIAQRFDRLAPAERSRLHERMTEWVRLSPEQRIAARLTFQEAQQLSPQARQELWAAYLALPEPQRQELAELAARAPDKGGRATVRGTISASSNAKSNIVPPPSPLVLPQPVAPAIVRAGPGVTTVPLRQATQPPRHLVPGLPKIAATPELVDPRTLAPRVGPQAPARADGRRP